MKKRNDQNTTSILNIEIYPKYEYYDLDYLKEIPPLQILNKNDHDEIFQIYKKHYIPEGLNDTIADFYIWLVENKETGDSLGYAGYLVQEVDGETEYEIAYGFDKRFRGHGFASEAARASKDWGIREKGLTRIISIVHLENTPSAKVAIRNDMIIERETIFKEIPVKIFVWEA